MATGPGLKVSKGVGKPQENHRKTGAVHPRAVAGGGGPAEVLKPPAGLKVQENHRKTIGKQGPYTRGRRRAGGRVTATGAGLKV